MIAYVLPTHNRPACLARTLEALGSLARHDAEVIVVDNASRPPARTLMALPNGLPVYVTMRGANEGAAARNAGARAADPSAEWIVMLDDDSRPLTLDFLDALREQPDDVGAVCAEIFLPPPFPLSTRHSMHDTSFLSHEAGGLPEVPIGCGVALRRQMFLDIGGYDASFGFYAEEYDLAARLIRAGHRIVMDRRFVVMHEKTPAGRSMDAILRRLLRNNSWVMQRYAPRGHRRTELTRTIARYGRIAVKERAELGYLAGLSELAWTLGRQPRAELDARQWERFTGKAACRRALLREWSDRRFTSAAIIQPGKNEHVVAECLEEMGTRMAPEADAEVLVIGTLSPGPMLDALATHPDDIRVIAPWDVPLAQPASSLQSVSIAA